MFIRGLKRFCLVLLVTTLFFHNVFAEEKMFSVTIAPALVRAELTPGETWKSNIKVTNPNRYDISIGVSALNMRAIGEDGNTSLIPQQQGFEIPVDALAQWMIFPNTTFFIPREKSVEVPFTISVPKDAPPGGHYGAVMVRASVGNTAQGIGEGSGSKIAQEVSTIFLIKIAGNIREDGFIREFSINKLFHQVADPSLFFRFENSGNIHLDIAGEVEVKNILNGYKKNVTLADNNDTFLHVLPRSTRSVLLKDNLVDEDWYSFGVYKTTLRVHYGVEKKQNAERVLFFVIFPTYFLVISIVFLVFIFFILSFSLKLYARHMIHAFTVRQESKMEEGRRNKIQEHLIDLSRKDDNK